MDSQNTSGTDEAKMKAAIDGVTKLKSINKQLTTLLEQAREQGKNISKIEKALANVKKMQAEIAGLVI
jgi:polysaccharide deacetylase 2 family uncharacterized protein YibQ